MIAIWKFNYLSFRAFCGIYNEVLQKISLSIVLIFYKFKLNILGSVIYSKIWNTKYMKLISLHRKNNLSVT